MRVDPIAASAIARPAGLTILLGALLTVTGSILPWAIRGNETVPGISDLGAGTLALGVAGAALLYVPYLRSAQDIPYGMAAMGAVLCGVLTIAAALYDMSHIDRVYAHLSELESEVHYVVAPHAGPGLHVTLVGGIVLALGGLTTALARPRAMIPGEPA